MRALVIRMAFVGLVVTATVGTAPGSALGDPAGPTNYESTISNVEPATTNVTFEVVGGDAFLEVVVAPGHTLAVPGYYREPYLRIDADGSVWVNEDSKTLYESEDRYRETEVPADADGLGEPRWRRVGSDGVYAWHDHRIHWMSRDLPPVAGGATRQFVFPWKLLVAIDGTETTINGELFWIPSTTPAPALAIAAAAIALTAALWRRRHTLLVGVALVGAGIAGIVVIAEHLATPAAARGFPMWIVLPLIAAAAAGAAAIRRPIAGFTSEHFTLLAGLTLVAWGFAAIDVLTMPILPSALPATLERVLAASVLGAGFGIAMLTVAAIFGWDRRGLSNATARH